MRLVFLLCLWETKPVLDSARALVKHTDSINSIAWTLLRNGGLKQFAALLLIAREKVMSPFDTGLTIEHLIKKEISLVPEDKPTLDQVEYKCILKDAQTLVGVFALAGDDLNSYCSSLQENVSVDDLVDDVSCLLMKHHIGMSTPDLNLGGSKIKGYEARGLSDSPDLNPLYRMSSSFQIKWRPKTALDQTSPYSRFYENIGYGYGPYWGISLPIPNCLQERHYSTRACGRMSKSLLPTVVSPMPNRLCYFAKKYIGKVRFP